MKNKNSKTEQVKFMRAVSTAGGGVMFIPDELERKDCSITYAQMVREEAVAPLTTMERLEILAEKIAALKAVSLRRKVA